MMELKELKHSEVIETIRVLNSLLSTTVPIEDQAAYGEYTKYKSALNEKDRYTITKKIMELVKAL